MNTDQSGETIQKSFLFSHAAQCRAGFEPCDERRLAEQKSPILTAQTTQPALRKLASWRAMAFLSDTDPDPTPPSTLCCDSTVGAYKHSDPEKKGKKERRKIKDRTRRSGFHANNQLKHGFKRGNNSIKVSLTPAVPVSNKFSFPSPAAPCRAGFEPCNKQHLSKQKSPALTAQTTQPV